MSDLIVPEKYLGTAELDQLLSEGYRIDHDEVLQEYRLLAPPVPLEFVDHPDAPLFKDHDQGRQIIQQLIEDIQRDPISFEFTPEVIDIYRQAGLVSLWFFLKFIAGFSGPYNDLNDSLHVSMCNYRQRQLAPGTRGAFFIFRSAFKSTIGSHGANGWEIYRDPNIRIIMISSKMDMAEQFMQSTMRIFDSNPLMELIAPEFVPEKDENGKVRNGINWTDHKFICPARSRYMPEPTMKCGAAGGSTQGLHGDLLSIDDIVGEAELNSEHSSTSEMIKKANWLDSNVETLLINPKYSRVFLSATRYAIDDPYESIMENSKEHLGNWDDVPYELNPKGVWTTYYRQAVEHDRLILPEKVDFEFLERLKKTNYWAYITQFMNNAHASESAEFSNYHLKEVKIDYLQNQGYVLSYFKAGEMVTKPLSSMEVTIGVDPAASERRKSIRTSRTAIVVRARDSEDNRFYIDGVVGYFEPSEFYDHLFNLYSKYKNYIRATNFEAGGPFKFVYNTLINEQSKRRIYLGLRKLSPLPDKDAKLRNFLQPLLEASLVYTSPPIGEYIRNEIRTFPGGYLKDTLDAMELADRNSIRPLSEEELRIEQEAAGYRSRVKNKAGY